MQPVVLGMLEIKEPDHGHLLVSGGIGSDGKVLKDRWLFNISAKKWKESLQVVLLQLYSTNVASYMNYRSHDLYLLETLLCMY